MKEEKETQKASTLTQRSLVGLSGKIVFYIAVIASLYHVYVSVAGLPESFKMRAIHLAFLLPLAFLLYPAKKQSSTHRFSWVDIVWFVLSLGASLYLGVIEYERFITRMVYVDELTMIDMAVGVILISAVLEATRRVVGWAMVMITGVILLYGLFGQYLPGIFSHSGYTFRRTIEHLVFTQEGIMGVPLGASATFIFLFVLFGEFLQRSGAGAFFIDIAYAMTGSSRGGPAKMAVLSSSLMGTVSGSAVGNVVSTGAYTIPLMKKVGYPPAFAGAVEAAASTGGQIMPPIMGAAAFILAEFVGLSYLQVALAAMIPAILYFLGVGFMVHFQAVRLGLEGLPKDQLPDWKKVLLERGHLSLPLVVTVAVMLMGYSPYLAAFFSLISVILVSSIKSDTRMNGKAIIETLSKGAQAGIIIAVTCACAGIIIGVASQTGFGVKFAAMVISLSQGSIYLALPLVMIASIILGMGVPTSAAYIMVAAMAVPALVELGMSPLASHMFAFYFAVVSAITPPVAIASYAAAGLANSEPIRTGFQAMKLGAGAFIVPYIFSFHEELLFQGEAWSILLNVGTAILGMIALASSLIGYMITKLSAADRILLSLSALGLINASGILITAASVAVIIFIWLRQRNRKKATKDVLNDVYLEN